ncbi:MAG: heparan-alpha-glucosaminide N-acetyltransferase domain-containing protein [Bernardetiaceae bacterium]|nr:heparan-alpha-glucosaminide N-acetyltransferase domain-containing protein [Bernardetiaceae bacterium]
MSNPTPRLQSLDVFRGITIAGMILVNNPGDWGHIYPPLAHAAWHGWTPTDLVFPFFLFIVGVAIVFALPAPGQPRPSGLGGKVARRAATIFGLGLLMAAYPFFNFEASPVELSSQVVKIRLMGVLQRIALCYAAASLLYLYAPPRTWYWLGSGLLLGYWALMAWAPVPGHGPGLWHDEVNNFAAYVDRLLIGENHLWAGAKRLRDPEGLLSTLPAMVTTLLGIRAGRWLKNADPAPEQRTLRLLVDGCLLAALGYVWDWGFPINKPLWTSSYVVFTAGLANCGLALCYYLVDQRGYRTWAFPFRVYGVNALIVFVLSGMLAETFGLFKVGEPPHRVAINYRLYEFYLQFLSENNASLAYALTWVGGWFLVLWWMFRRNIIIKV